MKKLFLALAIVAAVLSGCVQEEFSRNYPVKTVYASIENNEDTRARLSVEDRNAACMHWEEGDRISILSGNDNIPFDLVSGAGTSKASFHNDAGVPAGECYAVYPYVPGTSLVESTVNVVYPDELEYDAASARVKGGEYMVAKSFDGSFQFRNVHSYICLEFTSVEKDEILSIVLEARNGATVSGPASMTFSGETPIVRMTGSGKTVTVLMHNAPIGPDKSLSVSIPVAPVFSNGVKITVNGKSFGSRTFSSSVVVGRNQIVEMSDAPYTPAPVAMIGTSSYYSIEDAFAAAPKFRDPVIKLLYDCQSVDVVTAAGDKSMTLDLAGHTLKVKSLESRASSMTLMDSSTDGTGTLESVNEKTLQILSGECTIESGTVKSKDSITVYVMGDDSNAPHLTFNGGTITSTKAPSHIFVGSNASADMHGGTIVAPSGYGIHARAAVSGLYANVTVDGGSIIGSASNLFYAYTRSRIFVKDGFFQTGNGRVLHNGTSNTEVRIYIQGGHFHAVGYPTGRYFSGYNATSINHIYVSGGYFNVDPLAESVKAYSSQPLALAGRGSVRKLSTPATVNGYSFPYQIYDDPNLIVVGYSQNGSSSVTRDAFKKAFGDAGAQMDYFEEYATTDDEAVAYINRVDALVIPGSSNSDASNRSQCDLRLIRAALSQGKPVLGVCYGHQRICLVKGGSVPALTTMYPNSTVLHKQSIDGVNQVRVKELHSITIDKTSILYSLLKEENIMVNSSHNYCCVINNGKLKVTATAPDGCCEALESTTPGECLLGVQFHPEYLYSTIGRTKFLAIFQYIVDNAKARKEGNK